MIPASEQSLGGFAKVETLTMRMESSAALPEVLNLFIMECGEVQT